MDATRTRKAETETKDANSSVSDQITAITYSEGPRSPLMRQRYITINDEPSQVDRSPGNDTDINNIMDRFARTGQLPGTMPEPYYEDCTPFNRDLTELINEAREVQQRAQDFISTWSEQPEPPPPQQQPAPPEPTT